MKRLGFRKNMKNRKNREEIKMNKMFGRIAKKISVLGIAAAGITVPAAIGTLPVESVYAAGDVAINSTNFPDGVFRKYVSDNYDSNKDGKLSQKECNAVKEMFLNEEPEEIRSNITSFKGIENFTELTLFRIYDTEKLSELDTGKNTKLKTLHVWNEYSKSNIKVINVGKNVTSVDLWWSNVETLNISECTKLDNYLTGTLKNLIMRNNQEIVAFFNSKTDGKIQVTIDDTNIVKLGDSTDTSRGKGDFKLISKNPGTTKVTVTLDGKAFQKFNVTVRSNAKNGWVSEDGGMKYYKDGVAYTGWHWMTGAEGEKTPHWSYFGKDGKIYTGWKQMGKNEGETVTHWSYFGDNGWLRTGWQQMATKANPDGNNKVHWSYFGDNGWLRTGWQQMGKGTKNPDGNATKHWSYFGGNGWLRTGWQQMGKGTGNPDGNSAKHMSYFGPNGWLRTGMQDMGKGTNNPDGNSPRHKSYFGPNGWLVTNKQFSVAGKMHRADARGWVK